MEVRDSSSHFLIANTTSRQPFFTVTGLRPETSYLVTLYSSNAKGTSEPTSISAITMKEPQKQFTKSDDKQLVEGGFTITPILGVLLVVGGALILVVLSISVYFCFRRAPKNRRMNYTDSHIPLQKGIDDCIDGRSQELLRNPDIIPRNNGKKLEKFLGTHSIRLQVQIQEKTGVYPTA